MMKCNQCRFWHEDIDVRDPNDEDFGFGGCRVRAPAIVDSLVAAQIERPTYGQQIELDISTTDMVTATRFPTTFATDWCGEFQSRER
jgi:hypothetical protein